MQALKYIRFSAPVSSRLSAFVSCSVYSRKVMHDFKISLSPALHFVASIYPLLIRHSPEFPLYGRIHTNYRR